LVVKEVFRFRKMRLNHQGTKTPREDERTTVVTFSLQTAGESSTMRLTTVVIVGNG
jgi:hypothetical protein